MGMRSRLLSSSRRPSLLARFCIMLALAGAAAAVLQQLLSQPRASHRGDRATHIPRSEACSVVPAGHSCKPAKSTVDGAKPTRR